MVKEVEFSIKNKVLASGLSYSNKSNLFDGSLSTNGSVLNLTVNTDLPLQSDAVRRIYLYFGVFDYSVKALRYALISDIAPDYCNTLIDGNRTYTVDLSKVMAIPRKIYNTMGSSEISIELYTYEANITTDYGNKRLSVPYTITSDTKYEYDKSTDGVYSLLMLDIEPWVSTKTYMKGDIVNGDSPVVSLVNNNATTVTSSSWRSATGEDLVEFAKGNTANRPPRSVLADMMISRYAKYGIMIDVLKSLSYKGYDDEDSAMKLKQLMGIRELAKIRLQQHDVINAAYYLEMLKLASSESSNTTKVVNYNIKYTI